jgi:TrmH family RNA methyltransferase
MRWQPPARLARVQIRQVITSAENPRIRNALRLRKSRERRRSGLFLAEGRREVERAIAAGLVIREVFHSLELLPDWDASVAPASVRVEEVSGRVLAKVSYRSEPEGVIAVVEMPERAIPEHSTLLLVAVGIEKPGNLGAMARTADAAGADALLVAGANADPWNPNAIRASTGAVFSLPMVAATRAEVSRLPHRKVAAVLGAPTVHTDVDYTAPTVFLIGAEDEGLDDDWRAVADERVQIPMYGRTTDSLNASVAAAVLLFEAVRQRAQFRHDDSR